jgi:hypothetical protein
MTAEPKSEEMVAETVSRDDEASQNGVAAMPLHGRAREQLIKAMRLLNPPPAERERYRERIQAALSSLEFWEEFNGGLGSRQGKAALARYARDLRKLQASRATFSPLIHQLFLLEPSVIERDIAQAESLQMGYPRTHYNKAKHAVIMAAAYLQFRGYELTTTRKGKWHELEVLADTHRDLRHHMVALLCTTANVSCAGSAMKSCGSGSLPYGGVVNDARWRKSKKIFLLSAEGFAILRMMPRKVAADCGAMDEEHGTIWSPWHPLTAPSGDLWARQSDTRRQNCVL